MGAILGKAYIPHTAISKCTMGSMENYLNLPLDHGVVYTMAGLPLMNANDHIPGMHVITYGVCKTTKGPCVPVTPLAWNFVNRKHILDGAPALMECSKLTCMLGGVISIEPPEKEAAAEGARTDDQADETETAAAGDEPGMLQGMIHEFIDSKREQIMRTAGELYEEHKEELKSGAADAVFVDISPLEKLAGISARVSVDKFGQAYVTGNFYVGGGIGTVSGGVSKLLENGKNTMTKKAFKDYITGGSVGVSAIGGIGGGISLGRSGGIVDLAAGASAAVNVNAGYTVKIGDIFEDEK